MPSSQSWNTIVKLINAMMTRVVSTLFQSQGRMLISDEVVALMDLLVDFQNKKYSESLSFVENVCDENGSSNDEFSIREVEEAVSSSCSQVLLEFLEPFNKFQIDRSHIWLCLLLDPCYKYLEVACDLKRSLPIEFAVRAFNNQYEDVLFECLINIYKFSHPIKDLENSVQVATSEDEDDFAEYQNANLIGSDYYVLIRNEFLQYRGAAVLEASGNPLEWWMKNGYLYPTMAVAAKVILSIPPSQCDCEQSFNIAGIISQNKRSNISIEKMDMVIRLHDNLLNFDSGQRNKYTIG
eukprot:g3358.t1